MIFYCGSYLRSSQWLADTTPSKSTFNTHCNVEQHLIIVFNASDTSYSFFFSLQLPLNVRYDNSYFRNTAIYPRDWFTFFLHSFSNFSVISASRNNFFTMLSSPREWAKEKKEKKHPKWYEFHKIVKQVQFNLKIGSSSYIYSVLTQIQTTRTNWLNKQQSIHYGNKNSHKD